MTSAPAPVPLSGNEPRPTEPQAVVEAFLAALAEANLDLASSLMDTDIVYVNVGMPTLRGRTRVAKVLGGLSRPSTSFEVYLHAISSSGAVVLTERTDVLVFGPLRLQFWVTGRFDVHDAQITLWRDSFDYVDILRATVRGLAAVALPMLKPSAPLPSNPPGRHGR
jgi:limonene-1,2-epoxide hydrolase